MKELSDKNIAELLEDFKFDDSQAIRDDFSQNHLENLVAYNIELGGLDYKDYPDFSDSFITYAEHLDGQEFTDQELDYYNENYGDEIYDEVIKQIF